MKRLDLQDNNLNGRIPSEIGQLQGASILLEGNLFHNSSNTAPLSLCTLSNVKEFDLANDNILCPIERNALNDFYYLSKGAEWTNSTNWEDEYTSYCNWKGVTCENDRVTKLNLTNNGLSGRLSESIGNLTSIKVLDLSDNDIKVMILMCAECILLLSLQTLLNSHQTLLSPTSTHRDRFQQRLFYFLTSLTCVSATMHSLERHPMVWERQERFNCFNFKATGLLKYRIYHYWTTAFTTNQVSSRTVACHLPLKRPFSVTIVPCAVSTHVIARF